MNIKATYSKKFYKIFDNKVTLSNIDKSLEKLSYGAGTNANKLTAMDKGRLRKSKRHYKLQPFNYCIEWNIVYANMRYYVNNKNPHTKEWARKDYKNNEDKYLKYMLKGTFE